MASAYAIELPTFDIRNFTDRLTPTKQRDKYICPVCGGDDLGINPHPESGKPPAYKCFSGECAERDIREAIAPLAETLAQQGQSLRHYDKQRPKRSQPSARSNPPTPLPDRLRLIRYLESPDDFPQTQVKPHREHGTVRVTRYDYSPTQWVERVEWDDASKDKGYSKKFRQWHIAQAGESVPIWENGKRIGERPATEGEAICTKGDQAWDCYRFDEIFREQHRGHFSNAVLMVEGEGIVETLRRMGIVATTLQGSAWHDLEMRLLLGALAEDELSLVYLPDHDIPGERKAQKLAEACAQAKTPCLILDPMQICPELPHKGDAADMVKLMGNDEFILRLEAEIHRALQERQAQQADRRDRNTQDKPPVRNGQTPAQIAAEIAENYRDRLAWNDEEGFWYHYEAEFPGVWSRQSDTAIGAVVLAEFESRMGLEYKIGQIEQCIKILKLKLIVGKWEQPSHLLPFRNGVLDTQSGNFSAHAPGHRFTWALPRDHNPLANDWSKIKAWMDEATGGDLQIQNILLCYLNACLKGRSDLQRFLHLTGAGGTGKGTFLRLAISLIGKPNQHPTSLSDWCGNQFEAANAYKKRLLVFADQDKYAGGLENFKKATGGDELRGEIKNKTAFSFIFEGMVIMASNYPIFSGDTSSGIYRRLLMVPFNAIIPPHRRINMDAIFEPELAALTNYVLSIPDEIVSQTLRQSIDQSPEVIQRTWDWRMRLDSVAAWLNECVVHEPLASERVGDDRADETTLYGSYYRYCDRTGSKAKGSREFSPALLELCNNDPALAWGLEKKRAAGGFLIHGLRLRTAADTDLPYCLESLKANSNVAVECVGSSLDVGSDVGSNVESEPLQGAGCVGCVGSTNLLEKNSDPPPNDASQAETIANFPEEEGTSPYTPYTSEAQPAVETLHAHPTVQDQPSYTPQPNSELLPSEELADLIQVLAAVDSIEAFKSFYGRYEAATPAQQQQIANAIVEANLADRLYDWWERMDAEKDASEGAIEPTLALVRATLPNTQAVSAAPIAPIPEPAPEAQLERKTLIEQAIAAMSGLNCWHVSDYRRIRRQFEEEVLLEAIVQLDPRERETVERHRSFIARNG